MTQHIIDTDELEKLPRYEQDKFLVRYEDVVKLIANSPQADEAYGQDFNLEYTCTRIRRLLKLLNIPDPSDGKDHVLMGMLFTLLGTICRNVEVSQETAKEASARAIADHNTIMKQQVDDVRKDALVEKAKKMYIYMTDNHPTIHTNRFPTWDEISEEEKNEWIYKATKL